MDEKQAQNKVDEIDTTPETDEEKAARAAYRERMRIENMNRHERRKYVAEKRQFAKELVRRQRRQAEKDARKEK